MTGKRIPLTIHDGQLVLYAIVKTRARWRLVSFVIDTGSRDSYLNSNDLKELGISPNTRMQTELVCFGGTTFHKVPLPNVTIHIWTGRNQMDKDNYLHRPMKAYGLRTTTHRDQHHQQALPSILGMQFLREQQLTLHVDASEEIAFLESR